MSRRTQKPPVAKTSATTTIAAMQRASSVNGNDINNDSLMMNSQAKSEIASPYLANQSPATTYNAPEEPLKNPEI